MNTIAVVFPGIGYTCQKPLLYYLIKWLKSKNINVVELDYTSLGKEKMRGNSELIKEAVQDGVEIYNHKVDPGAMEKADRVIFVGKSIGSAVATHVYNQLSRDNKQKTELILLTPLEETFEVPVSEEAMVFHGNKDPWADTGKIIDLCKKNGIMLQMIKDGNHSLETNPASAVTKALLPGSRLKAG